MDDFTMRVASYLENAINIARLKEHEFGIIETKSIPVIVNPSAMSWRTSVLKYTNVQIDFDLKTADMFDDILENCRPFMMTQAFDSARMIRRFAFPISSFRYHINGHTYSMINSRITGQLCGPLVETSGAGLQIIVTGRSNKIS